MAKRILLPQSAVADTPDSLVRGLQLELPSISFELPLEDACTSGGWPGDMISIEVLNATFSQTETVAVVRLHVQEIIGGVSCGAHQNVGVTVLHLWLDRITTVATWSLFDSSSPE